MSDYLERKDKKRGHVWFLVGLVILFIILAFSKITKAAESDSLYFTSATDMMRQVNSVIGVCDTVWVWKSNIWFLKDSSEVAQTGSVFHVPSDPEAKAKDLKTPIITCRDLIAVGVVSPLKWVEDWIYYGDTLSVGYYQGQMVVWWREVAR